MKPYLENCVIEKLEKLNNTIFDITIKTENIANITLPGQFIHIKCGEQNFLRRPISVCDTNKNSLRFVFEVKGSGTKYLSERKIGEKINVLGPLGKGFDLSKAKEKKKVFVGGGIGIFPLFKCEKEDPDNSITILGFRNKESIIMEDEFRKCCQKLFITTDDGSYGEKGFVTTPLENVLKNEEVGCVYACGPMPMLKNIAKIAEKYNVPCEISLEERMGCGIGSCLVCACRIKSGDGEKYLHVCKDGPVFDSRSVIFDD